MPTLCTHAVPCKLTYYHLFIFLYVYLLTALFLQVEADSQIVWEKVLAGTSGLDDAESWHKASITINGHEVDPWTVTVGRKRKLESDDSIVSVVGEGKSEDVPTVFSFPCKR